MNTKFLKLTLLALVVFTASCSNDDKENETVVAETETVSNLSAPQTGGQGQPIGGAFTKFSFSKNAVVTDESWDIAFRGTTILVNGGTKIGGLTDEPERSGQGAISIVSGTFASVKTLPEATTFKADAASTYAIPTGTGNGWYTYGVVGLHIVAPIAGKVFVVKTHDGKYAKFEILSYYKDMPAEPNYMTSQSPYYTFNFAYQANSNTTF